MQCRTQVKTISNSNTYCNSRLNRQQFFRNNEKYNICTFNQEIKYLKADAFVISSNLILVSEWTISRNQLW